jgi:hypothetical protein
VELAFALRMPRRCFEETFRVPPHHRLVQVRSRARGGIVRGVYWAHEEYDPRGHLVARYESYQEVSEGAPRRSGWCKLDEAGRVLAHGDSIPMRADELA